MDKHIYSCLLLCFQITILASSIHVEATIEADIDKIVWFFNAENENDHAEAITKIIDTHLKVHKNTTRERDLFLSISDYFYDEALYKEAVKYFELINSSLSEEDVFKGEIYYHVGRFYNALNRKNKAEKSFFKSLDIICDSPYLYRVNAELLDLYSKIQKFDEAENYGLKALKLSDHYAASDIDLFRIHRLMMTICIDERDYDKADYHMHKIYYYANNIDQPEFIFSAKLEQISNYMSTSRFDKGVKLIEQLELNDDLPDGIIHNYYYLKGLTSYSSGDYDKAIIFFKLGLTFTHGVKSHGLAMTHSWLGNSYVEVCEFEAGIHEKKKTIELYLKSPDMFSRYVMYIYRGIGNYYRHLGDIQKSLDNYTYAKKLITDNPITRISINRNFILSYGELLKDEFIPSNLDSLFSIMNKTHDDILEWNFNRHYVYNDRYRESPIRSFYDASLEVLYFLYKYTHDPLIANRIVNYSSSLQSIVYHNNKIKFDPFLGGSVSSEVINNEKAIKDKILKLKKESEKKIVFNKKDDSSINFLDSIEMLKEEYKQYMITQIPYAKEVLNRWEMSRTLINDVQNNLREEEALISYYCSDNHISNKHLYTTVISKNNISFFSKKITLEILENIKRFIQSVSQPIHFDYICYEESKIEYNIAANELYHFLLKDELESLSTKPKHLIVLADNLVKSLPFNSLLTEQSGTEDSFKDFQYLINNCSIAYDYSLQSFLRHKKKKRRTRQNFYVGFSPEYAESPTEIAYNQDSVQSTLDYFALRGGVVNLPNAKQGVIDISTQFESGIAHISMNASKALFKKNLGTSDIIHFAGHAVIDNDNPEYSQFLFSGTNEDLNLHAHELFDLRMDTELAMLSACDTGKGDVQSGKSLQSISQAFSFAGASSLTMSFYKIPDAQTALIDKYFIQNVQKGIRLDEALQQSNLKYLEQSSEKYAHPFYWAGIALSGKTEPLKKRSFWSKIFI